MKRVEVVAAVIQKDGKVFAARRGYGAQKDFWEFPGGKIEAGELPEAALEREICEELACTIRVEKYLQTVELDTSQFHLTMHAYLCVLLSGMPVLKEHEDACWIGAADLESLDWLPADRLLLPSVKELLK